MAKRRKILIVVNAEWYFLLHYIALARGLRERGYEVVIAAAVERDMADAFEAEGFRLIELPLVRGRVSLLAELRALLALVRLYRLEAPDLVYQLTIKPILYGSFSAWLSGAVRRRVNLIPGLGHVFSPHTWFGRIRLRLVVAAYRMALSSSQSRVIFQNHDDLARFVQLEVVRPTQAVVIRGSGIDLELFCPTPEPPADGAPIVLLASRLIWDKGVGELVEATRRLKSMSVACRTVIVGMPDIYNPRNIPIETLEEWQREGLIEWWGQRSDMREVVSQAAVIVLPSYYPEGVPRILLEGAASARPIVTTNTPGCRDAVVDEKTGLLVPPRDVDALVLALRRLLVDSSLRAAMGVEGRRLAEESFGLERVVAANVAICEQLLAES